MIQDSVNQMLGSMAIGSRLISDAHRSKLQDKSNLLNSQINNYKSTISHQESMKDNLDSLEKQNKALAEQIATNNNLTDRERQEISAKYDANQKEMTRLNKKGSNLLKEGEDIKQQMAKTAKLDIKDGVIDDNDQKGISPFDKTFYKGMQSDVISTLRDAGNKALNRDTGYNNEYTNSLNKSNVSNLSSELKNVNKELSASNKAKMSMVRKAKQKVAQANDNFITNFGKSSELPQKMREFVENEMKKGGQQ